MGTGIDDIEQECKICGKKCGGRRSLGTHLGRTHHTTTEQYVIDHLLDGVRPMCKCGCGAMASWNKTAVRFNDYRSGHNPTSENFSHHVKTPEQIAKRNESIRRAYAERGDEIKKKISERVTATFSDAAHEGFFSRKMLERWRDNEEFRHNFSKSQKRAWTGERGADRRRRVFTREFGRKIAKANSRRMHRCVSHAERKFVVQLRERGYVVTSTKYFEFDERTWNADAWIEQFNALIEFDGTYWHGVPSNCNSDQIVNAANDIEKNLIAKKHGLTLLRFHEGVQLDDITSPTFEALADLAYHVVVDGEVRKEGTFKFADDGATIITRENLVRLQLDGDKKTSIIEQKMLPALKRFFAAYVAYWGWFYPDPPKESLADILAQLKRLDRHDPKNVSIATVGSTWLKAFSRSYWDVDGGPAQATLDERRFEPVLRYRLGLNESKLYEYRLSDGTTVSCHETFDINLKNVRTGLIVQRNKVSWFKPHTAADVYRRFAGDCAAPTVWDPSAGFAARMLGFASVFDRGTYVCCEPATKTHADLVRLADEIQRVKPDVKFSVNRACSETFTLPPNSVDLVFTSPPYHDQERYYDEPGQCWIEHRSYDEWLCDYVLPTFTIAFAALRPGRMMVINVSPKYEQDVIVVAQRVGFDNVDTLKMSLNVDHFSRKKGTVRADRCEPFIVFKRA